MSRSSTRSLQVPASNGAGTPAVVRDLTRVAVYVHAPGTMVASVQIEGKVGDDHNDWMAIEDVITGENTLVQVPEGITHVRVSRTGTTNANVRAEVTGHLRGE